MHSPGGGLLFLYKYASAAPTSKYSFQTNDSQQGEVSFSFMPSTSAVNLSDKRVQQPMPMICCEVRGSGKERCRTWCHCTDEWETWKDGGNICVYPVWSHEKNTDTSVLSSNYVVQYFGVSDLCLHFDFILRVFRDQNLQAKIQSKCLSNRLSPACCPSTGLKLLLGDPLLAPPPSQL